MPAAGMRSTFRKRSRYGPCSSQGCTSLSRLLLAIAVALGGVGCTTPPHSLDPAAASVIRTIALSVPSDPSLGYSLMSMCDVRMIAIPMATGRPADPEDQRNCANYRLKPDFNRTMAQHGVHVGLDLRDALRPALAGMGYRVVEANIEMDRTGEVRREQVEGLQADALLHVVIISAGYSDDIAGGDFAPRVKARVRLIDIRSAGALLEQWVYYDAYAAPTSRALTGADGSRVVATDETAMLGAIVLPPPVSDAFTSPEQVLADPVRAAAGLRSGGAMIAREIAAEFERALTKLERKG
jgi:hypothetical protein